MDNLHGQLEVSLLIGDRNVIVGQVKPLVMAHDSWNNPAVIGTTT